MLNTNLPDAFVLRNHKLNSLLCQFSLHDSQLSRLHFCYLSLTEACLSAVKHFLFDTTIIHHSHRQSAVTDDKQGISSIRIKIIIIKWRRFEKGDVVVLQIVLYLLSFQPVVHSTNYVVLVIYQADCLFK